jgi:mRNA-degrading endonuclease RelE of RelBE toxin-antitoxin system
MKVEISPQVIEFLQSLAPEPRRALIRAIKRLPAGHGDVKRLQKDFERFWRLRVKTYRVIFRHEEQVVHCEFAERRSTVYELFAAQLKKRENRR